MQRGDNLRTLAYSRGNSLHRCRTHIANGEYASESGLECVSSGGGTSDRIAGRHEALCVQRHAGAGQKMGVGFRADEQEQMADWPRCYLAGRPARPMYRAQQAVLTFQPADLSAGYDLNI